MTEGMITKYCLKVKFEGLDSETFFDVDQCEFERLKALWPRLSRPQFCAFFEMSDGTQVMLCTDRVETVRFALDTSLEEIPALKNVREEDWVLKVHMLGRPEPEYLAIDSPEAATEFLHGPVQALGSGVSTPLFLSIEDRDGESFCLSRERLLYVAVPKRVVDEGGKKSKGSP